MEAHKHAVKTLALQPRFRNASFKEFKKDLQPVAYKIAGEFVKGYEPGKEKKDCTFMESRDQEKHT
jgi:hypothetical protein